MIRRSVLAGLGMLAASAGAAADPADEFRAALARLPPQAEDPQRPVLATFVDLALATDLAGSDGIQQRDLRSRLTSPERLGSMGQMRIGARSGEVPWLGADPTSFRSVIGRRGGGRGDTAVWRLRSAETVTGLLDSLHQTTHRPVPGATDLLTDPRPLQALYEMPSFSHSPWYNPDGASVLGGAGDLLLQAPTADEVVRLRSVVPERSLGSDPAVRLLLRSFADATGRILQASLLSPRIGEQQDLRRPPQVVAGLPPWRLAVMVDLQDGDRPALLLALAYADCGAAREAERRLAPMWMEADFLERGGRRYSYNTVSPAELRTQVVAENGQCAAVVAIRSRFAGRGTTPHALAVMALGMRDFALLRIAGQGAR